MVQLYKRKGGEILVNTETLNVQANARIAVLAGGGFVVTWNDSSAVGTDTSGFGIKAQRFDGDGNPLGGEFLVNTTVAANQTGPDVAALPSGRFVITWTDASATGGDTSSNAVRGQMFEANGTPVGTEFLINVQTVGSQSGPSITELAGGGFVVAWLDSGSGGGLPRIIKGMVFDANGVVTAGELQLNTASQGTSGAAGLSVTALPGGGFAAVYGVFGPVSGQIKGTVWLQLFDATGTRVGPEQVVNADPLGNFNTLNIAALDHGFVVTWAQQDSSQAPGVPVTFDVHAQLFDASGTKSGAEFIVNTTTAGTQSAADVDRLPGGGFLVTWSGPAEGTADVNVYGQFFDDNGDRVGGEFIVNTVTNGTQNGARVDVLPSGDIVITWNDNSATGGDTSSTGVKMQILTLSTDAPTDIAISSTTVSETQIDNRPVATLSATGAINSSFTYTIVSDFSGGAFRIDGDKLVIDDNHKLDFETDSSVQLTVRATDLNGQSYDEVLNLTIADAAIEARYAAGDVIAAPPPSGDFQGSSHITPLANGNYLVTWLNIGAGPSGLRGQLYDAGGTLIGSEFAASVGSRGGTDSSIVAMPGGGFMTVYEGDSIVVGPGSNAFPINAQIFDAAGAPIGGQILVSTVNQSILSHPDAALLGNGNVITVWALPVDENGGGFGSQISAQILDANGNKVGGEFRVNTQTDGGQGVPQVAALNGGGFVVIWTDDDTQGFNAQRFDNAGTKIGGQFDILADLPNAEDGQLAALEGGGFVVVFGSEDDSTHQIEAHIFNSSGTQTANVVVLDPQDLGFLDIGTPHVANLSGGGFVVSWSTGIVGLEGTVLIAQIFDAAGQAAGDPFLVEDEEENGAEESLATTSGGDVLFSWSHFFRDPAGNPMGDVKLRVFSTTDILGTTGSDLLFGTAGDDDMHGFGGNDGFLFGAAFTAADHVDGGAGANDQIGLQGDYTGAHALTLGASTMVNIEALVVLPGFSYDITSNDGNVAAGGLLQVQATQLAAGQSLHFNGSAETDGAFRFFGGQGNDDLTGGTGNDGFYFGPNGFNGNDVLNGGGGNNDQLGLDGDYGSAGSPLVLGTNLSNIEVVVLLAGPAGTPNHFNITTVEGFVGAGQTEAIFGLQTSTGFTFDGSNEHDGAFRVYGGTGNDVITGGAGNDWIFGGNGTDTLYGGAGNDVFYYDALSQSNPNDGRDGIQDFATGDKLDLSGIDAIAGGGDDAFTFLGAGAFTSQAGELRAEQTAGPIWTVSGDVNGDGVADFEVLVLVGDAHPLGAGDFTF